ncbi:hypothetical protein N9987_00050 [bacterium]|jgi:hypothetical protein|nr:hypothetical protein [bacterium]
MAFNISDFKSTLDKFGGPARTSLFEVVITKSREVNAEITSRDLTFFCSSVNMPGVNIEAVPMTAVAQRPVYFPTGVQTEPLNASFLVDSNHQVLTFMHNWIQRVTNYSSANGPMGAIGSEGDLQLPYEMGYKTGAGGYSCNMSIKHYSTESTGGKFYEVLLENVYPYNIGDVELAWEQNDQYMRLPVNFYYDKISYSGDRTGRQTFANGRGLLETLGDLAGFVDVVRQTVNQGKPDSIQDAVNRLQRVRNSYGNLTSFLDG